jgi:hypothetical protein
MPYAENLHDLETLINGYVGELTQERVSRRAGLVRSSLLCAPLWVGAVSAVVAIFSGAVAGTVATSGFAGFLGGGVLSLVWLEGAARETLERWVVETSDPYGKVSALDLLEPFGGIAALPIAMLDDVKTSKYRPGSIDSALVWWWSQLTPEQRTVISSQGRVTNTTVGDVLEAFERCTS